MSPGTGLLACVLSAALVSGGRTAAGGVAPTGFVEETLDNGLHVSVLADSTMPVVATQVWYHVGTADETDGSRGLAHLVEHLMFGATQHYPEGEYARLHHRHGGRQNAYTTPDETVYVSEIAPEAHAEVLAMEADRMVNLAFDAERLARERRVVAEELRLRTENNAIVRAAVAVQRAVLDGHPYAYLPADTMAEVSSATVEQVGAFYRAYYHPGNAHVVVVGPVDPDEELAAVRRLFGAIPAGGEAPPRIPALLGWPLDDSVEVEEDIPPVEVAAEGFVLPPADAPDRWAVAVLTRLLADRANDPLRESLVRRRGKAVEAGIEAAQLRRGGAIVLYSASIPYRRRGTAFRLLEEERTRLARMDWLTEGTLEGAKRGLQVESLEERYLAGRMAAEVGRACWWEGDARAAFGRDRAIEAVTRAQVAAAFDTYVGGATPVRVWVRPERIPLLVRLFGWLYPLVGR